MGVFGVFFGCRGATGFNGCCLGACSGDGGFMLARVSGCKGVNGFKAATSLCPVREKLAQRAHNTLILAFLVLLGELFRGSAGGGAVLGEVFRANRPAPVLEAARHPPDRWRRGRALRWCNAQSADHLAHNCPFSSFLLRWSVIWTQRCLVWRACSCANPLLRAVTRYLAHGRCCPGS